MTMTEQHQPGETNKATNRSTDGPAEAASTDATADGSTVAGNWIDPRFAEGRSRIVLFVGMGGLGLGTTFSLPAVSLGGIALIVVAFTLNTAGKLVHYGDLGLSLRRQAALVSSWCSLATAVVGLLATYALTRYWAFTGQYFWSLAVAAVGFGLLHMAAQSRYLPAGGSAEKSG